MRIAADDGSIEIECARDNDEYYADIVVVRVDVDGFSGEARAFVQTDAWRAFVSQVATLEQTRQGAARLQSFSPGAIDLTVRSVDRAGHMAFEGQIGQQGTFRAVYLRFDAVEFDPTELPRIVRELQRLWPSS